AIIAAHRLDHPSSSARGEIRITFSSPFDATLCDAYRWPLEAGDDLRAISASISAFLRECRLDSVLVVPDTQPDRHPARTHESLLLTVADLAAIGPASVRGNGGAAGRH
ncbi:MAG: hypothetical protein H7125_09185, partial [Proteobacteria bacterium]|nr:hypothetical protein [Burkholderiales bacterium]